MGLSTQQLRDEFKNHLEEWEVLVGEKNTKSDLLPTIQKWGDHIEKSLQEKIRLLEMDFSEYRLNDEYLRSVTEGFSDLEHIMRNSKTLLDVTKGEDLVHILQKIKNHYTLYVVPLLNSMAKLENDYRAIANQAILKKQKNISELEKKLKILRQEKMRAQRIFFDFRKNKKLFEISKKIKSIELNRKLIRLTLHHDKLNLQYIHCNRPPELIEIKERANRLRIELQNLEETKNVESK